MALAAPPAANAQDGVYDVIMVHVDDCANGAYDRSLDVDGRFDVFPLGNEVRVFTTPDYIREWGSPETDWYWAGSAQRAERHGRTLCLLIDPAAFQAAPFSGTLKVAGMLITFRHDGAVEWEPTHVFCPEDLARPGNPDPRRAPIDGRRMDEKPPPGYKAGGPFTWRNHCSPDFGGFPGNVWQSVAPAPAPVSSRDNESDADEENRGCRLPDGTCDNNTTGALCDLMEGTVLDGLCPSPGPAATPPPLQPDPPEPPPPLDEPEAPVVIGPYCGHFVGAWTFMAGGGAREWTNGATVVLRSDGTAQEHAADGQPMREGTWSCDGTTASADWIQQDALSFALDQFQLVSVDGEEPLLCRPDRLCGSQLPLDAGTIEGIWRFPDGKVLRIEGGNGYWDVVGPIAAFQFQNGEHGMREIQEIKVPGSPPGQRVYSAKVLHKSQSGQELGWHSYHYVLLDANRVQDGSITWTRQQ